MRNGVLAGERITDENLHVVSISSDDSFPSIAAANRAVVVGQYAKVRIAAGALLVTDAIQPQELVDPERIRLNVVVPAGLVPVGLREQSRVSLVVTPAAVRRRPPAAGARRGDRAVGAAQPGGAHRVRRQRARHGAAHRRDRPAVAQPRRHGGVGERRRARPERHVPGPRRGSSASARSTTSSATSPARRPCPPRRRRSRPSTRQHAERPSPRERRDDDRRGVRGRRDRGVDDDVVAPRRDAAARSTRRSSASAIHPAAMWPHGPSCPSRLGGRRRCPAPIATGRPSSTTRRSCHRDCA